MPDTTMAPAGGTAAPPAAAVPPQRSAGSPARAAHRATPSALQRVQDMALRLTGAGLLAVTAYIHFSLAPGRRFGLQPLTLGDLFAVQGVLATLAAVWLLTRGSRQAWMAGLLVCGVSLVAVVTSRYRAEVHTGPFPSLYEPVWYTEKTVSAVVEATFGVVWVLAALLRGRHRRLP
jgi:hypothetical protein